MRHAERSALQPYMRSRVTFGNSICSQYMCSTAGGASLMQENSIGERDSRCLGVKGHYTQITPQ